MEYEASGLERRQQVDDDNDNGQRLDTDDLTCTLVGSGTEHAERPGRRVFFACVYITCAYVEWRRRRRRRLYVGGAVVLLKLF